MAEQVKAPVSQYEQSGNEEGSDNNKRKYDGDAEGVGSKEHHSAPSAETYNEVPPPMTDFDLAKKKAEELAAKYSADVEAKRMKKDQFIQEPPEPAPQSYQQQSYQGSYGGSLTTKKVDVPNNKVGLVIGKGGETIKYLQQESGAKIQVTRDSDADPSSLTRAVDLVGTPDQISRAEKLLNEVINEHFQPGGYASKGSQDQGSETVTIHVPNGKVGLVIGRGGETIKALQSKSGARVQVQSDKEMEPGATERIVTVIGTKKAIEMASEYIAEVIDEVLSESANPNIDHL